MQHRPGSNPWPVEHDLHPSTPPSGERLARLEVVTQHLTEHQRAQSMRVEHQAEGLSRAFQRIGLVETTIGPMRETVARLSDLPERLRRQEELAEDKRRSKQEQRELRREAMATVQWLLFLALIVGSILGRVPADVLKAAGPALGFGK